MGKRKSNREPAADVEVGLSRRESLGAGLLQAGAALLGALIVWAFLAPMDATSVFLGAALPQNLRFWQHETLRPVSRVWGTYGQKTRSIRKLIHGKIQP